MKMKLSIGIMLFIGLAAALGLPACQTEKAPPAPVLVAPVVERKPAEVPDVIKIAIRFVKYEGRALDLLAESAFVKSQDREAYYVAFRRKTVRPHMTLEAVVKVLKMNGRAEWEEY